ncbi:hypothetical protein DSECCO2_158730 [anaerobic digester metagenome]
MKKKIISILLCCCTVMGFAPVTALAADAETEISLMMMDFREVKADQQGDNWTWDASDKILTLNNFQGVVKTGIREKSSAILLPKDSTLYLEGKDNKITTNSYHCNGVYSEGDLIIDGKGKLEINIESAGASGVYVNSGVLSIDSKAEINVDSPRHAIYIYDLKANKVAVTVNDDAKVTFPDDLTDDAVFVVTKSGVDPKSITFDYEETRDKDEEIVTLSKAETKAPETPVETPEEKPTEEVKENTYLITIGNKEIKKNGETAYTADAVPYITNGYTMLPLRALLVLSDPNVDIKWDATTKTAQISYNNKLFTLVANQKYMTKDSTTIDLATATEIQDGRLFVSLRDWMKIMEVDDTHVSWNSETKTVTLKH